MSDFNNRDVEMAKATGTGNVLGGDIDGYLRGLHLVSSGTAGSVVLKSSGSGGTTILDVDTPAVAEGDTVTIPGRGIRFSGALHATLTNVDGITVFYTRR